MRFQAGWLGMSTVKYILALTFVGVSYICGSISFVVIMRVFGVKLKNSTMLNIGLASMVLQNLIAQPAGLSLRLLLLERHQVDNSQTVASSLLLAYFKNLLYFSLIPISLVYIAVSHPLPSFGIATILLITLLLLALFALASSVVFNTRLRAFIVKGIGSIWHLLTHRDIHSRLTQFNDAVTEGVSRLRQERKYRLPLLGMIALDVAATIAAFWLCFAALGIPVHLGVLITAFNFGITLTVISFIPGDMGVQEASIAGVLALFGMPFSGGVLVAILFRVLYYFVPFIFSLGFYWSLLSKPSGASK
jgi:uncharacterized protein (TIRG00374 family)